MIHSKYPKGNTMDVAIVNTIFLVATLLCLLLLNDTVSKTAKNVETILDKMDKE